MTTQGFTAEEWAAAEALADGKELPGQDEQATEKKRSRKGRGLRLTGAERKWEEQRKKEKD